MIEVDPELVSKVQFNCDLSDARFAGNYTMCIYLLKMREYYRWRHGMSLRDSLSMHEVGEWVHETESRWDTIETSDWERVPVNGEYRDAFDDEAINRVLVPENMVFSSGLARFGKPVFFLAECLESQVRDEFVVYVAGKEYARELAAPPAMTRGNRIFLRKESIERMLWETVEEWLWHRRPGAMGKVVEHYGFETDFPAALEHLVSDQIGQLLLHEQGEFLAGQMLGDDWDDMVLQGVGGQTENLARAVRDCLADCIAVLPELVQADRPELIHFYFAIMTPLRKELFPSLLRAYREWLEGSSLNVMDKVVEEGRESFLEGARLLLERHRCHLPVADSLPVRIEELHC